MLTDVGEYLVGAYLQQVKCCDFVDYNVRPPGGGLKGLAEFDVVGFNFKTKKVYMCEVTTHILGLLYEDIPQTVKRLMEKHQRQKEYASVYLANFKPIYQFWSPVVPVGKITKQLKECKELELVINRKYKRRMKVLQKLAKTVTHDTGNPAFRFLQIFGHMRETEA